MNTSKYERGQAIVLLVIAMVGLLGFAGVALDGGFMYSERRRAQNTADNAALAGALKKTQHQESSCGAGTYCLSAAQNVLEQNGYADDADTDWQVNNPPTMGVYAGNSSYVEVIIVQDVSTVFAHLVYSGPAQVSVQAVAKADPSTSGPIVPGNALVALNETACEALKFSGNGTVNITGGGIFSNSDSTEKVQNCYSGEVTSASATLNVATGGINMVADWDAHPNATVNGTLNVPVSALDDLSTFPTPPCNATDMTDQGAWSGSGAMLPGRYTSIGVGSPYSATMASGLYCVNGDVDIQGDLTGTGVVIYIQAGSGGTFETNAGSNISLSAPTAANCAASIPVGLVCDYNGLLLYIGAGNTDLVRINGSGSVSFTGTIYAPDAPVRINGSSGTFGLSSQVIANTVEITGSGDVSIDFDPGDQLAVSEPVTIELSE